MHVHAYFLFVCVEVVVVVVLGSCIIYILTMRILDLSAHSGDPLRSSNLLWLYTEFNPESDSTKAYLE